jgi:GTP-binding protein
MNAVFSKDVALASQLPGRTRRLNYYILKDLLTLIDFPGYGFARVKKEESENWLNQIEACVIKRKNLLKIYLLLDARFDLFDSDKDFLKFCGENGVSTQVINQPIKIKRLY